MKLNNNLDSLNLEKIKKLRTTSALQHHNFLDYWDWGKNEIRPDEVPRRSSKVFLKYKCCNESRKTTIHNLEKSRHNMCYKHAQEYTGKKNSSPKGKTVADFPYMLEQWSPNNKVSPKEVGTQSCRYFLWICPKGHERKVMVSNIYKGRKCGICFPSLSYKNGSKAEVEIINYLSENFNYNILHNKNIGKLNVDIILPEIGLAIEYNGKYWHSNQKIIEKYKKPAKIYHQERKDYIEKKGFKLLYIWEKDWKKNTDYIKEELKEAIKNKQFNKSIFNKMEGEE